MTPIWEEPMEWIQSKAFYAWPDVVNVTGCMGVSKTSVLYINWWITTYPGEGSGQGELKWADAAELFKVSWIIQFSERVSWLIEMHPCTWAVMTSKSHIKVILSRWLMHPCSLGAALISRMNITAGCTCRGKVRGCPWTKVCIHINRDRYWDKQIGGARRRNPVMSWLIMMLTSARITIV